MATPRNTNATTNGSSAGGTDDTTRTCVDRGDGYLFYKIFLVTWDDPHIDAHLGNKRGWMGDMITCLIQNCNRAWGLRHIAPQELRYWDEVDTDKEINPLPKGEKRGRDKEDNSEDSWDPHASIDMIATGWKPSKSPWHILNHCYRTNDVSYRGTILGGPKLGAQFKMILQRGQVATKQLRNPTG